MEKSKKAEIVYQNPFPVTAVANFHNNVQNNLIVETNAIKRAKTLVDTWIKNNDGVTVAVQGEYGTGKTQLAIELKKYISNYDEDTFSFICLDSPSDGFLKMYRDRFLNELTKKQVLKRLQECYSQIIIDDLKEDDLYSEIINRQTKLMKGLELVQKLGLPKSKYDRIFEKRLKDVTNNAYFVPALLLLMEPQFEDEVWKWFGGTDPSEALKERAVDFSIDNDSLALDAIGVFAFLFGQQGCKFVLFIDEMEKILSNTEEMQLGSFDALKKLFATVKATKSLLILCGLPDYYEAFPRDVQQRIGYEIKTKEITLSEVKSYISNANQLTNNIKSCSPFSDEILKIIIDISHGNIRTIIRLLYHSCNWYLNNNQDIDVKTLCMILNSVYGLDTDNVQTGLEQMIISMGWLFKEKKESGNDNANMVMDFWLPAVGTSLDSFDRGIEIYIVSNMVSDEDYQGICKKIHNESLNCKIIVVKGFISKKYYNLLSKDAKHVLQYRTHDFKAIFLSVIEGEQAAYQNEFNRDNIIITNEKIDQLTRIVRNAVSEANSKFIGKQEFYYFIDKFFEDKNHSFYELPSKDSEFYLMLHELQQAIDNRTINMDISDRRQVEVGALYFIREINFIIYYAFEEPQKPLISYIHFNMHQSLRVFHQFVDEMVSYQVKSLSPDLNRYYYLLDCFCSYYDGSYEQRNKNMIEDYVLIPPIVRPYNNNSLLDTSNAMKQLSQYFCTFIVNRFPQILSEYCDLFIRYYFNIYSIDSIIYRNERNIDMFEVLPEYYDLIRKYLDDELFQPRYISELFSNYERLLRRTLYG